MDTGLAVVLAAGAAAVASTVSPLLLSRLNDKQAHAIQLANYARQDQVAAKAAEVAAQAAEAARLLLLRDAEVARIAKENAEATAATLASIHTLVNSTLSGAIEGELDARTKLFAALDELRQRDIADGRTSTPEESAALVVVQDKITELTATVAERAAQTELADAQQKGKPTKAAS